MYNFDLKFHSPPEWIDRAEIFVTPYDCEPAPLRQARFRGRDVLVPSVDLNAYRADALIDWICFRFHTTKRRQAENVRRVVNEALGELGREQNAYVTGPDDAQRYTGDTFLVRLQDPQRFLVHYVQMKLLEKYKSLEWSITPVFTIHSMEVSIDFRVKQASEMKAYQRHLLRWQLVEALRRHLRVNPEYTKLPLAPPRVVVGKKSKMRPIIKPKVQRYGEKLATEWLARDFTPKWTNLLHKSAYRQPEIDGTYYVGPKEGPILIRIMDKTTDRRNARSGKFITLPAGDERARIEATLFFEHPDLRKHVKVPPIGRLEEVHNWNFQAIRPKLFEFFYPTVSNNTWLRREFKGSIAEREAFKRAGVYGVDKVYQAEQEAREQHWRHGHGTKPPSLGKNTRLISYTDLNKKLDRALSRLSTAWWPSKPVLDDTELL